MSDDPGNFEKALAELERVVERLEKGDLPLEQTLEQFERGIALTRQCQKALQASEQKVEMLLKNSDDADTVPLDPPS